MLYVCTSCVQCQYKLHVYYTTINILCVAEVIGQYLHTVLLSTIRLKEKWPLRKSVPLSIRHTASGHSVRSRF